MPIDNLRNRHTRNNSLRTDHALLVITPLPAFAPLRHPGPLSVHLAKWTLSDISTPPAGQSDRTLTVQVKEDHFYMLSEAGQHRILANWRRFAKCYDRDLKVLL